MVPTEPPAVEPAPQFFGASAYPVLCCSPRHLGLTPSVMVGSESTTPDDGPVAVAMVAPMAALPMAEAPASALASPFLLGL